MVCLQVHHQVAEAVCDHPELLQCARVVTWLEALFRKTQDYQAEQEAGTLCPDLSVFNKLSQMPNAGCHDNIYHVWNLLIQNAQNHLHGLSVINSSAYSCNAVAVGPRFHHNSGVWTDTHIALHRQDHNGGLVTELDPDATTRYGSRQCTRC